MATGRYSTFPTVIDKLKLLPELKDMTVVQVGKIARYSELIIKGKNGTLTSAEQLELDALHQEMKTYTLSPTDWNTVISAMINIEKYLNDTILPEIGTMVDNAELQINTSVTNGVSVVDNKVNSVIPQIDKYISDLITNPTNAVTIGHLRNQFIITNETNTIAIGIHGFNANTDILTLIVSGTQYYEYKNGSGDYTIDVSNNTITLVGTKKFYVDEIVLIEVVKNVMKSVPTMDVSLVADNSILRVKLDQDTQNAINDIANKQDKTDNTLTTTDKTIVGGINEVNDKATVLTEQLGEIATKCLYVGITSGTSTAYTSTTDKLTVYNDGDTVTIVPHVNSGNNPTLNINNLGALPLVDSDGNPVELKANKPYTFVRVGSYFFIRGGGKKENPILVPKESPNIPSRVFGMYIIKDDFEYLMSYSGSTLTRKKYSHPYVLLETISIDTGLTITEFKSRYRRDYILVAGTKDGKKYINIYDFNLNLISTNEIYATALYGVGYDFKTNELMITHSTDIMFYRNGIKINQYNYSFGSSYGFTTWERVSDSLWLGVGIDTAYAYNTITNTLQNNSCKASDVFATILNFKEV